MRGLMLSTFVAAFLLVPTTVDADGLLYKLPADGTSATFDLEFTIDRNGMKVEMEGTLTMSSVGTETVDDEKCRWIEFKLVLSVNGQENTIVSKMLIPEKQLKKGKTPLKHVKKSWVKMRDQEVKEFTDFEGRDAGPLPAFLAGPLKDEQKLAKEVVESKLGKLECAGITGSLKYKQSSDENEVFYETRLHDKAPFGIVTSKITINVNRDGQLRRSMIISLKLTDVAKDATTDLPNNN